MNITQLNHAYTPPELAKINDQLAAVLGADELDDSHLLSLINQRHELIQVHLSNLSKAKEKAFAEAENVVNERLRNHLQDISRHNLEFLSRLIRGRKAVGQYK